MSKRFYIVAFVALLVAALAYLFFSYIYIYRSIGAADLAFPDTQHFYTVGNPAAGAGKIYVSLGDSLTAGVGVDDYTKSYPYLLAQLLAGKASVELKNLSWPGAKTKNVIASLPAALAAKPDVVTLLVGVNDIHDRKMTAAEFEQNYRTILETLTKKTEAKIYVISIPYIGARALFLPPFNYSFNYETTKFNDIIRRLAGEYKLPYIDIATPTRSLFSSDATLYSIDSFHPSAAGYKLWSDILYADINR